jgi:hypothetical protein
MLFTHPLARAANVWTADLGDGITKRILVIVTNAELDKDSRKYKPDNIARLSDAAREFLNETNSADGFLLANRMRDWPKPEL